MKGSDRMQASITGKTSMHEGGRLNLYHNWRDYNDLKWNKDGHIDYSRSVLNEYEDWKGNKLTGIVPCQENVNLAPEPLDFFEDTFGESLSDFNERNKEKHPDRVKTMEQYYKQQKRNVREVEIQLSDHDNYVKLCQEIGQKAADDFHKQFLHECIDHWKEHYVNDGAGLVPISIAIHMDETKNGTPHAQLTFARIGKSNRGMKIKASCDGAMEAIGFKKNGEKGLVYRDWLEQAREDFEDIARKYINLVPHAKATVPHTDSKTYNAKQAQKKKAAQKEAEEFKQAAESKTSTSRIYKGKVLLSEDDFKDLVDKAAEGYTKQIELDKANEKVENFGRSLLEARREINRGKEEANQAKTKS